MAVAHLTSAVSRCSIAKGHSHTVNTRTSWHRLSAHRPATPLSACKSLWSDRHVKVAINLPRNRRSVQPALTDALLCSATIGIIIHLRSRNPAARCLPSLHFDQRLQVRHVQATAALAPRGRRRRHQTRRGIHSQLLRFHRLQLLPPLQDVSQRHLARFVQSYAFPTTISSASSHWRHWTQRSKNGALWDTTLQMRLKRACFHFILIIASREFYFRLLLMVVSRPPDSSCPADAVCGPPTCEAARKPLPNKADRQVRSRHSSHSSGPIRSSSRLGRRLGYFSGSTHRAFSFWGSVVGVAIMLGPVVGRLITQYVGWRWIFSVNLPVGLSMIAMTLYAVEDSKDPQAKRARHRRCHDIQWLSDIADACPYIGQPRRMVE